MLQHCGHHPLLLQKTLNEITQAKLQGWAIDMDSLELDRIPIYEMLWRMRNKREITVLFTAISNQTVINNHISKTLHQRGLMVDNKLFCSGFATSIPQALIPDTETAESFLTKIRKDPDKALKNAERWNTWFELLEKGVNRVGKVWKAFKDDESEE